MAIALDGAGWARLLCPIAMGEHTLPTSLQAVEGKRRAMPPHTTTTSAHIIERLCTAIITLFC